MSEQIAIRDNFVCCKCGKYIGLSGAPAHRIANTKANKKIYGNEIINHVYNQVYSCITNECNDFWNIGNNKKKSEQLALLIKTCGHFNFSTSEVNKLIDFEIKE